MRAFPRFGHGLLSYVLPATFLLAGCGGAGSVEPPSVAGITSLASAAGRTTDTGFSSSGGSRRLAAPITASAPVPTLAGCALFPANNPWNTNVANAPVDPNSADYLAAMGAATKTIGLNFPGPGGGIPVNIVNAAPTTPISFTYAAESDPGPYPIPAAPLVEASADAHMLILDAQKCDLYETWATSIGAAGSVTAGSGAHWSLASNALRPDGWTSADAAGLPILPALVKYDEVVAGAVNHALRFTYGATASRHIFPATHDAGNSTAAWAPPMGLRLRLKASFDTSALTGQSLVIARALQRYGMLLADNGGDFAITGETDARWDSSSLDPVRAIPASAFEVVDPPAL